MHNIPFTCPESPPPPSDAPPANASVTTCVPHHFIDVAHPDPDLTWPQQLLLNVVSVFYKTSPVLSWMDQKLFLSSFNLPLLLLLKGHSDNPRRRGETSSWYKPVEDEEQDLSKSYLLVLSLPILLHCLHDPGIAPRDPLSHASSPFFISCCCCMVSAPGKIFPWSHSYGLNYRASPGKAPSYLRLTLANFLASS